MRLALDFYQRDAITVAKDLLAKVLVRRVKGQEIRARIVETEAYVGPEDKGCHAYQNKRTKRTEVMFWPGGYTYVYLIYGMYNCLNIVTGSEDKPEAVLIRAIEPLDGLDIIKENRVIKSKKLANLTNGPGKLCQALDIDRELNGYNLNRGDDLYLEDNHEVVEVAKAKRINIDYAQEYKDKLWRFYIKNNGFLSK